MTIFVYVNTSKQVGDAEHIKVFANQDAAETWVAENDPLPLLMLALIWINRKSSAPSVMPGKWVAGETPLPGRPSTMQRSRFAVLLEVITGNGGGRAHVLLGPHKLASLRTQRGVELRPYSPHAALEQVEKPP